MVQCNQQRSFRNGQKGDHSFSMWWITRLLEAIASYNCNCRTYLGVMYIQHVPFFKDEYSQYNTFFWSFYDFVLFLACTGTSSMIELLSIFFVSFGCLKHEACHFVLSKFSQINLHAMMSNAFWHHWE